jgi:hypothetical protein
MIIISGSNIYLEMYLQYPYFGTNSILKNTLFLFGFMGLVTFAANMLTRLVG